MKKLLEGKSHDLDPLSKQVLQHAYELRGMRLLLLRNGELVAERCWQGERWEIAGITAGEYGLKTETGWVLWQRALPDLALKEPLKLAAATEEVEPYIEEQEEWGTIRVFHGIESGRIILERDPKTDP